MRRASNAERASMKPRADSAEFASIVSVRISFGAAECTAPTRGRNLAGVSAPTRSAVKHPMDEHGADRLLRQVVAGLPPTVAALVKERIGPEQLRDLTAEAALNAGRRHNSEDTMSESTISELRRLVLLRLPESPHPSG